MRVAGGSCPCLVVERGCCARVSPGRPSMAGGIGTDRPCRVTRPRPRFGQAPGCQRSSGVQAGRRCVNAGFSRVLRLDGIWVRRVQFATDWVVVWVAFRRRRLRCPMCTNSMPHRRNHQQVVSIWRHLDLGVWRLELRAQGRRLECPERGVRVDGVPFARHASGFTRDFEALVAWSATSGQDDDLAAGRDRLGHRRADHQPCVRRSA